MAKLPATSYVRLVDIWLIFGQLMPFIEVTSFFLFSATHNIICLIQPDLAYHSEHERRIERSALQRQLKSKAIFKLRRQIRRHRARLVCDQTLNNLNSGCCSCY